MHFNLFSLPQQSQSPRKISSRMQDQTSVTIHFYNSGILYENGTPSRFTRTYWRANATANLCKQEAYDHSE